MDKISEVLTRGVEKIYPSGEALEKVLRSGKKIRLYNGIDPTGPLLHLGHMVVLRKLRQFQDLGHHVILLIGDFTGMIGDPSGKSKTRVPMSREQVLANAKTYREQATKILRFTGKNPVEIKYNSEWLGKLGLAEIMNLASLVTYPQVIERDMFQKRIKEGQDIFVNELFYPLMQGYDSVAMGIDLEVGGSDQTFNMLMGRTLMKKIKNKEKFVLTMKLLAEPGKVKMGKTEGNLIALTEKPNEMFGKIMAWPDEMIVPGFTLLTDVSLEEVQKSQKQNPMALKKKLAKEIVTQLHSEKEALEAEKEFKRVFQKRELPSQVPTLKIQVKGSIPVTDLLFNLKLASSKSEAKRLVNQGAVEINEQKVKDPSEKKTLENGDVIRVGKRKIIKVKIE